MIHYKQSVRLHREKTEKTENTNTPWDKTIWILYLKNQRETIKKTKVLFYILTVLFCLHNQGRSSFLYKVHVTEDWIHYDEWRCDWLGVIICAYTVHSAVLV